MSNEFRNGHRGDEGRYRLPGDDGRREDAVPSRPHAGTIVWGLVAIAVGLLVLAGLWWDISFNLGYVLIALLIGSGLALVAAGIVSLVRGRSAGRGPDETESRL